MTHLVSECQAVVDVNSILKPRQVPFCDSAVELLISGHSVLNVASTGFGKSYAIAGVIKKLIDRGVVKTGLILQHREELVYQNKEKFFNVTGLETGTVDGTCKVWGDFTFATRQTLARKANLDKMPSLDVIVVDEAHNIMCPEYKRIVAKAREINPNCLLFGVTATPNRDDKQRLGAFFNAVGDTVLTGELVSLGYLCKPQFIVKDIANKELKKVKMLGSDFDMKQVDSVLNTIPVNKEAVDIWLEHAGDRKTAIFCSTIAHAEAVYNEIRSRGVKVCLLHSKTKKADRKMILEDYKHGRYKVIVNVSVLTEGWDDPLTSCIVLLRPSCHKGLYIQIVGRGLRTAEGKKDCIVLDFGMNVERHGDLMQEAILTENNKKKNTPKEKGREDKEPKTKKCIDCGAIIPLSADYCPICGIEQDDEKVMADYIMRRYGCSISFGSYGDTLLTGKRSQKKRDKASREAKVLFSNSPFRWETITVNHGYTKEVITMCSGTVEGLALKAGKTKYRFTVSVVEHDYNASSDKIRVITTCQPIDSRDAQTIRIDEVIVGRAEAYSHAVNLVNSRFGDLIEEATGERVKHLTANEMFCRYPNVSTGIKWKKWHAIPITPEQKAFLSDTLMRDEGLENLTAYQASVLYHYNKTIRPYLNPQE